MRTSLFDYDLPPEHIALRPVSPRDAARLLVVRSAGTPEFEDRGVGDPPHRLWRGDTLVLNDTKVTPARLTGRRLRGAADAKVEATLTARTAPDTWRALAKPGKRLAVGDRVRFRNEGRIFLLC